MAQDLRKVNDIESLMTYFSEKLGWAIDPDDYYDIDDITYDFEAADLGLKEEAFAKITSLKQLRPLVDNQRWGIFFVNFESNRFEVSALRKILSGLIPARRNSDHAVWDKKDLLFLCTWGERNKVTIGAAHFEDSEKGLPQIKMISCEPAVEDFTQINVFEQRLSKLAWPSDPTDAEAWHEAWASAFTTRYRQTIQDAHTLTIRLAEEAQNIRDRILSTLEIETANGYVHLLYNKFRETLVHDMTEQQFADMYAQTVVYGLFSARCMDETQDDFNAAEAVECIPNTNPFLKSLLQECLGSSNSKSKLSFDELEVGNIVDLLLHTKTDSIISDFNRQTGGGREDPVIHFYEEFLSEYDKTQRVQRGVYYTPQPVVNFIVRAVDDILKKDFGVVDGLASTDTKKIKYLRESKKRVDGLFRTMVEDEKVVPAIQILDPATGTGTFLRQTILQIYQNFCDARKGQPKDMIQAEWNAYVPEHLLPRLNGFELMMAPYAVAHMKLAMVLKDTGYQFDSDERLRVYLTNSLEKPGNSDAQLTLWDDPLAFEAVSANAAKKNSGINIVLGNPPYAVSSANKNPWIESLLEPYKTEPGGKQKLKEQKHSIDSDETKFIRYGQCVISAGGSGILAYINPHGYLDKPTFRGMRWQLLDFFDDIYVINLHGNSNHQETSPDGSKDENVFDIQQGVCINIFVKKGVNKTGLAKVYYTDLYGSRDLKYSKLNASNIENIGFELLQPTEPYYMFVPTNGDKTKQYYAGFCLEKLLCTHLEGIQTGKDKLVLQPSFETLDAVIKDFTALDTETARLKYDLGNDGRDWGVGLAQQDLQKNYPGNGHYFKVALRPFDLRYSFYTGNSSGFIKCCRDKVSREMIGHKNLAFVLTRNAMPQKPYSNFLVVDTCVVGRFIGDFTTSTQVFPVFTFSEQFGKEVRHVNMASEQIARIEKALGLKFVEEDGVFPNSFTVMDLVGYIYAYLNSWKYRNEFKEVMCRDFPYIPYPTSKRRFFQLAKLGNDLISVHTNFELPFTAQTTFEGAGNNTVTAVKYKNNKVYINKTQAFSNVSAEVWDYWMGGHQIVQKWIKERKNCTLTNADVNHYHRIIHIVTETIKLSGEIDQIL